MPSIPSDAGADVPIACVVLAAGKGTRMRSRRPKVLHDVGGRSMLAHVLSATATLTPERVALVVGHGAETVADAARAVDPDVRVVIQEPQRGTGDAVRCAREALAGFAGDVVVLYGDTPLIRVETLQAMAAARRAGADLVTLGFEAAVPGGYGRLVLDADGGLDRIVEARDASPEIAAITLCNSGVMCIDGARLFPWLDRIDANNAAGELYLTDIVAVARADGAACAVVRTDEAEVLGVNSRAELARAEAAFQNRARSAAMAEGATLIAPETVFFAADTQLGQDVTVGPFVVFGPGVTIEDDVEIRAYSHLEGCAVAQGAQIGPYARLRPGARIGPGARVGNFVEVKNASLGAEAKANHLSYIGDAEVGDAANIGAGTITCNYDGFAKHSTQIGHDAFIGSNTALVAPVRVGDRATIAAGSTITQDVEDDGLGIARARQEVKPGRAALLRKALAAKKNDNPR